MFVRYGKDHNSKAYQKKLIKYYNSISFRFYSPPKENLDIDIHYVIGYYTHLWFTHEIDFNIFSQLFYNYLSKNQLFKKNFQSRAQLIAELGRAIDFAPKELFKLLSFFEKENARREKIKKHFMPLLKLISLAPRWNEVLKERCDKNTELSGIFLEKARNEFVGDQENKSPKEAEVDAALSAKGKALIDFIEKNLDFEDMKKVFKNSEVSESVQNVRLTQLTQKKSIASFYCQKIRA